MSAQSVWQLIRVTAAGWSDNNAPRLGAALSFYTMMSIAPLLVISIRISGLVFGREAAQGRIAGQLSGLIGPEGGIAIQGLIEHATNPATGAVAAVLGLLVLLFGASGVFGELRDSLNQIWGVKTNSAGGLMALVRYRFFSFAMVVGIGFLLLVSLLLSAAIAAAGKFFGGFLPMPEPVMHMASVILTFAAVTVLFALLYKVVPDGHVEWKDVWIGALVTAFLFSVAKLGIGIYLGKASVGSAYGAAGSLVVFMVWVYYSAQIFFLGAQFTHTFAERHGSRAIARAERTARRQEAADLRSPRLDDVKLVGK